uniref:Uncharacterized protein n=1 Tax=Anguilla anguilla TaxID=7936 RepID=A0A0E9RQ97_ANGAN
MLLLRLTTSPSISYIICHPISVLLHMIITQRAEHLSLLYHISHIRKTFERFTAQTRIFSKSHLKTIPW